MNSGTGVILDQEAPGAAYPFQVGRLPAFARNASVAALLLLLTLSSAFVPGTADLARWQLWARNMDRRGITQGYAINHGDYPPFASMILLGARRVGAQWDVAPVLFVKLGILVFLLLTTLTVYLWTRSFRLAVLSHVSLLLGTVALGYLDSFFAPALIISLWALKEDRLALFAFSFSMACLIKWQPLIIAPFVFIHLWSRVYAHHGFERASRAVRILAPAALVVVPTALIFGAADMRHALVKAMSHTFLSGNALNVNWILTHWLHVFHPEQFGGLVQGQAEYIRTSVPGIVFPPRLLFYGTFATALLVYSKRDKTFEQLVFWSLLGYLSYFMLNTGVHENHLFIAVLLSMVLFWIRAEYRPLMVFVILASNLNLLVFYGVTGSAFAFPRVLGGVDSALILSIVNVLVFGGIFIASVRSRLASVQSRSMQPRW